MKLNKSLKLSLGVLFSLPLSLLVGNDILANNLSEKFDYNFYTENLVACGGGGGGMSPADRAAKKTKQAKAKLNFKKRQLSKKAAAGESTTKLQAEIAELEALIAK